MTSKIFIFLARRPSNPDYEGGGIETSIINAPANIEVITSQKVSWSCGIFPFLFVVFVAACALTGCATKMYYETSSPNYSLKFSDDEFDVEKFNILEASYRVYQVGIVKLESGVNLYEFKIENGHILYKNGNVVEGNIFITLNEPPGRGPPNGQGARVYICEGGGSSWVPVGRALLTLR